MTSAGLWALLRWRSRSGRRPVAGETRKLIRQMCLANPLSGAPRIHGELLKLGIQVSQATVAKYTYSGRGVNWKFAPHRRTSSAHGEQNTRSFAPAEATVVSVENRR
jgi:hypothetical protein